MIAARTETLQDIHMFERAQPSEGRLGDSPPDHYSNEDLVDAMTATLAAQNVAEHTVRAFNTAFETSKADIAASSASLREVSASLLDDTVGQAALAEQLWSNGWSSTTTAAVPAMPADFLESDLNARLWSIAQSYR